MRVEITSNAMGQGTVKVDGLDLGHIVQSIEIGCDAGEPVRVALRLCPAAIKLDATTEAKLIEIKRASLAELKGDATCICSRCGADRFREPCGAYGTGCPMIGSAHADDLERASIRSRPST